MTAIEQYHYNGTHNNYPIHITTTFEKKNNQSIITTTIDTKKIQEKNTTIIKNNQLIKMTQTTHNEIDSEYFDWQIQKKETTYTILFENNRYNETFKTKIKDNSAISLQGLIYQLRNEDLEINDIIKANLIIPWKTILPIRFIVKEKQPFNIQDTSIPAIKISIEINTVFGTLLPKSTLWVTEKKPHILLKQSGLNKEYTISKLPH